MTAGRPSPVDLLRDERGVIVNFLVKTLVVFALLGLIAYDLGQVVVAQVKAQDAAEVKRLTILTFTAPVQLPGVTLPAGKYRFEMADVNNAAHTVRVLTPPPGWS